MVKVELPHKLRYHLAMILIHCTNTNAQELWDTYKSDFSEDYVRLKHLPPHIAELLTLKKLNKILEYYDSCLLKFMPFDLYETDRLIKNFFKEKKSEMTAIF